MLISQCNVHRAVLCLLVVVCTAMPPVLAACTSVEKQGNPLGPEYVDFNAMWTARGYPCGPSLQRVTLQLAQRGKQVIGSGVTDSECITAGDVVFRATIPGEGVLLAGLPLSLRVELTLGGTRPRKVNGNLQVQSADELELDAGDVTLLLTRGAGDDAGSTDASAADSGGPAQDAAADAGGEPAKPDAGKPAADGGVTSGSGGSGGNQPSAGNGTAGAGAGGAGSGGMPAAGSGGKSGSGGMSGASGASGAMAGGPAAGSGGAPPVSTGRWFCLQYGTACSCVRNTAQQSDLCSAPKPTCCFTLSALGQDACQCWPEQSTTCRNYMSEAPNAKKVATCPPP